MVHRVHALSCALFLICLFNAWGAVHAAPPVEAFGNLPAIADVRVSPDGRRIAMLQTMRGRTVATIYEMGAPAGTQPLIFNPDEGKVRAIEWANNERLLVWMSITFRPPGGRQQVVFEVERILSLNRDGSESKFLFRGSDFNYVFTAPRIISLLPNDPDHILMLQLDMALLDEGGARIGSKLAHRAYEGISVYKVNVKSGHEERVETGWRETRDWIIDSSATVRIRIDKGNQTVIYARSSGGGDFREIARYDEEDPRSALSFWGFGNDPNKVYVTARQDSGRRGVYTYDLTSAKIDGTTFLHDRFDVSNDLLRDPYTDRFIGARYTDHLIKSAYWDQTYAAIEKKLEAVFKDQSVSILSMSRDRNAIALLVEAPHNPGTFYLYEPGSRQVSPLGQRYPGITAPDIGPVRPLSYQARDGLTIPAYLTLPPDREAKNLPLVVLPHGGPETRDDQSFDWWASFYASRGYAVLQPNFRGSSGYGQKFVEAGYGEFGGKMQDDLTDGVKHLVAEGIADPKRVCIVGASYGGYAALAGAAFTPELYACAVSVAGMSDLSVMMGHASRRSKYESGSLLSVDYWQRWLGNRHSDAEKMKASSPAEQAGNVRAAILLIHGKDDTVVPFLQSEIMAKALTKAGKPHRLVEFQGVDHWLSQADSRIRILKETEAFLKEHIGQ